ncbi:MAG: hemerythrin domain-containing protein [Alphaproteobacteria bacterium]|nr:hemerythrin domain-containing protein [Alphaproteobacteria bacterium]
MKRRLTRTGASGRRKPTKRRPGNGALELLRRDHDAVSALFERYERLAERGAESKKADIARTICAELTVHAAIEEDVFYPALRDHDPDAASLLDEADVEHASLKALIAQIKAGSPGDGHYDARVKVLGEYVKHHVKEEQSEIFAAARASGMDLKALGADLAARKAELKK